MKFTTREQYLQALVEKLTPRLAEASAREVGMKTREIGPCWHCGALAAHQCARCHKPVCVTLGATATPTVSCAVLRRAPGQIGVYRLVCWPKCVHRRSPAVLAIVNKIEARDAACADRGPEADLGLAAACEKCEHGRELGACAPCYVAQHPDEFEPVEHDPIESFRVSISETWNPE